PRADDTLADAHQDLAFARRDDAGAVRRLHSGDPLELGVTLHLAATLGLRRDACRGTTDVEGPQRELRTRLADRLGGQDSDRLADVDDAHGGQVAAVAHLAEAASALAGENRAN